jgi:DNA-binding CsgD family transcriptional regulator
LIIRNLYAYDKKLGVDMEIATNADISDATALSDANHVLGASLAALADELAHGVLIISMDGYLLHANPAAWQELSKRQVLRLQHNYLQAHSFVDAAVLEEAMAKLADGKRSLIRMKGSDGPSLTLAAIPLKLDIGLRPHAAALIFARTSVCEPPMLCFFARNHGLTRTEEHVLDILCQGYSAPQIAVQMKIAVSTVRSHIRSLCAKTKSSSVRELINRLGVLPPVGLTFRSEPMH